MHSNSGGIRVLIVFKILPIETGFPIPNAREGLKNKSGVKSVLKGEGCEVVSKSSERFFVGEKAVSP
ncbi:hypothetical protein GWO13_08255 [Candidatus Bathyarchaeota archaeon]|nr:hypothetical protein [Candidatus Bathyarchaeota archaeon]